MKTHLSMSLALAGVVFVLGLAAVNVVNAAPAHTEAAGPSASSASAASSPSAAAPLRVSAVLTPMAHLPIVIGGGGVISGSIKNGGFELGPTIWITQSTNGTDPLIYEDADLLQGTSPHTGNWAAWLGDLNNENATLRQTALVPAGAPYLEYWQMIASNESGCADDVARVLINGTVAPGSETGLCAATATKPTWVRKSLDLRAYAGQNVIIDFNMKTDAALPSSWLLDDIGFSATP
jgi:hypothetical protein